MALLCFTYFPKLSRSDANPAGDQSHLVPIGDSDHTHTHQKSDQPPEKNKEEPTKSSTDENQMTASKIDSIELIPHVLSGII